MKMRSKFLEFDPVIFVYRNLLEPALDLCPWYDKVFSDVALEANCLHDVFYKAAMFVPTLDRGQRSRQTFVPMQLKQEVADSPSWRRIFPCLPLRATFLAPFKSSLFDWND